MEIIKILLIGLNIGGTMPFPVPANIDKIDGYSSSLTPSLKAQALTQVNENVGVSVGLALDNKGMESSATVKEYSMNFENFEGRFDGKVDTEFSANYISLPVRVHYIFTKTFSLNAGAYYSYMLSGKFKGAAYDGKLRDIDGARVDITTPQNYDFSKELSNHDTGLCLGLNYLPYNEHILLSFDFNYGLFSVFPDNFNGIAYNMQNVYANVSLGYVF